MKKQGFFFLLILILLPVAILAQDITNGLVGYWPFTGNADDESGNGNNGTIYGALLTTDRFGNENSAYHFDGVDDYMYFSGTVNGIRSISLWFCPNINLNDQTTIGQSILVRNGISATPGGDEFTLRVDCQGWSNPGELVFSNGQGNTILFSGINSWNANQWHHVVITIDEINGSKLYVDKALVSSNAETSPINNFDNLTALGRWGNYEGERFFNGKIDEVMVFTRALSESEITEIYDLNTNLQTSDGWQTGGDNIYINDANVGIGTSNTFGYKLAVNGVIGAKEVNIEVESPWPDYVFDTDYSLLSINELEQYITKNNHLPEMPTAEEVDKSGISVGEMNTLLLKKMEELTLYLIELKKENQLLKDEKDTQIKELMERIENLESGISN